MENFGKFCFAVMALTITTLFNGFVFAKLWLWIVVTTFGVQTITTIQGIALAFFISSFFKSAPKEEKEVTWKWFGNQFFKSIFMSTFVLLFGYLYYSFLK